MHGRILAVALATLLAAAPTAPAQAPAAPGPESDLPLPGGGTRILPDRRVVMIYGHPGKPGLGVLGRGTPVGAAGRALAFARPFRGERPVLLAFDLVATVAQRTPGRDRSYTKQISHDTVWKYLKAVRAAGGILLLDVQPGRRTFEQAARAWKPWLHEPDVGLALDPEWRSRKGIPGKPPGRIATNEINRISAWLDELAEADALPQKLLLVHHFRPRQIATPETLVQRSRVAVVAGFDGIGARRSKTARYRRFADDLGAGWYHGVMVFLRRDARPLPPPLLLGLLPQPDVVGYQ